MHKLIFAIKLTFFLHLIISRVESNQLVVIVVFIAPCWLLFCLPERVRLEPTPWDQVASTMTTELPKNVL